MIIVYAVESGQYSDYHINAIFSTKELAQEFIDSSKFSTYDDPSIAEWELDPEAYKAAPGHLWYTVFIDLETGNNAQTYEDEGSALYREPPEDQVYLQGPKNNTKAVLKITVQATDNKHAIKIANERRTAWKLNH